MRPTSSQTYNLYRNISHRRLSDTEASATWNSPNCRCSSRSPTSAASRAPPTRLHRTQPAISQAVRRLEDELGERLFDRSAKDGKLTEAGRVLLDYASG